MTDRRCCIGLLLVLACAGAGLAQPAWAQPGYPNKPIRLVVPFPAGGATDLLARAIAQRVGQGLGQNLVVENRAGAGGSLGSAEVAKAPADGYTLLIATSSTHAIGPHLNPNLPYRALGPDSDFTPIAHVANATNLVLVPTSLVQLVKEVRADETDALYATGVVEWAGEQYPVRDLPRLFDDTEGLAAGTGYSSVLLLKR